MLVGFDHADDAGVYQIAPNQALVQTVDFFTPIVDDPHTFGQIAATNSLSDVYAMGGRPLTALALVCFPEKADLAILERILAGGLSKMMEAGCTVIGGHSIRDEETKFGYSVTGLIHPEKVLTNGGARPGDALVLTKAIGTGVISTAIKKQKADNSWVDAAIASMTTLNKSAAELLNEQGISGARDDGRDRLRSHRSCARAGAGQQSVDRVACCECPSPAWRTRVCARGTRARRTQSQSRFCRVHGGVRETNVSSDVKTLLFDPQTAGGLLISVSAEVAHDLVAQLRDVGLPAAHIGDVRPSTKSVIHVL